MGGSGNGGGPDRNSNSRSASTGGDKKTSTTSNCDFDFLIQLDGIKKSILNQVAPNSVLLVRLEKVGSGYTSVVCEAPAGILGTLAGFPHLAELIACIEAQNKYRATVIKVDKGFCTVRVQRAP